MIRLFAALSLPPEIVKGLVRRQSGIEFARWRPTEALHITLRFFGDVREDVARDLDLELARIEVPPFELMLEGVGDFGDSHQLSTVWAGVEESLLLRRLADACETAARRAGLKPETRNYKPHVTLAYLKHPDPTEVAGWIQSHNLLKSPSFAVERFGLYASTLGREGSHYRLEAEYPLR